MAKRFKSPARAYWYLKYRLWRINRPVIERLLADELIYGTSFHSVDQSGLIKRTDPKAVIVERARAK